jgi:hypothetical protein
MAPAPKSAAPPPQNLLFESKVVLMPVVASF